MFHHHHHVHLLASDMGKALDFHTTSFAGEAIVDFEVAGARNIFMRVGTGRIHFTTRLREILAAEASTILTPHGMMRG